MELSVKSAVRTGLGSQAPRFCLHPSCQLQLVGLLLLFQLPACHVQASKPKHRQIHLLPRNPPYVSLQASSTPQPPSCPALPSCIVPPCATVPRHGLPRRLDCSMSYFSLASFLAVANLAKRCANALKRNMSSTGGFRFSLLRAAPSLSRCTEPFMMAWMRTAACSWNQERWTARALTDLCGLRAELHGVDLVPVALHLAARIVRQAANRCQKPVARGPWPRAEASPSRRLPLPARVDYPPERWHAVTPDSQRGLLLFEFLLPLALDFELDRCTLRVLLYLEPKQSRSMQG